MDLQGKVAIVTGAGGAGVGGLGVVYAEALAAAGAAVVVSDIDGAAAESVAKNLVDGGAMAIGVCADVASEHDVSAMAEAAIRAFGARRIGIVTPYLPDADRNVAAFFAALGVVVVCALNYSRITALYFVLKFDRQVFDFAHGYLFPALAVVGLVLFFAWWLRAQPTPIVPGA